LALIVPVVAAIAGVVTVGFGSASGSPPVHANELTIKDFQFRPAPLQVKAGATVSVVNFDQVFHSVTADNQAFDTATVRQGHPVTITIRQPGTYRYHCTFHPYMTGVIRAS
jgi:plastocyanin